MISDEEEQIPLISSYNSHSNPSISYGTVPLGGLEETERVSPELETNVDANEFGLLSLPYEIVAYLFRPRDDLEDEFDDIVYDEDDERIPEDILPLINFLLALLITMFSFLVFSAIMAFILVQAHITIWDLFSLFFRGWNNFK
jgi:hypothetical protein